MTDREILELAAKAMGYRSFDWLDAPNLNVYEEDGTHHTFNPLNDDGDALRLAAKLRISIDFNDCCAWSRGVFGSVFGLVQEFWGGDYPNCYRNAIVRAAAEIGRHSHG